MNLKNWVMSTLLGISPVSTTNAEPIRTNNNTAKPKTMALKDTLQRHYLLTVSELIWPLTIFKKPNMICCV